MESMASVMSMLTREQRQAVGRRMRVDRDPTDLQQAVLRYLRREGEARARGCQVSAVEMSERVQSAAGQHVASASRPHGAATSGDDTGAAGRGAASCAG